MQIGTDWITLKSFAVARNISIQYVQTSDTYYLFAIDGPAELDSQISITSPAGTDQTDFETNYKSNANQPLLPSLTTVTTQYELNNKDLKLARSYGAVDSTGSATISMKIPGTFGSAAGRYIEGGYGISEDYNKDDYVLLWVSDDDRNIAMMVALAGDPTATTPVSDATIQGMGVVPGIGLALPNYPVIKTYYDDEVASGNAGWYFWPIAQGDSLPPVGETEVESIAGYAFGPGGLYLKIQYCRPSGITTGGLRINYSWARLDS
jgi:hypothetical protein